MTSPTHNRDPLQSEFDRLEQIRDEQIERAYAAYLAECNRLQAEYKAACGRLIIAFEMAVLTGEIPRVLAPGTDTVQ